MATTERVIRCVISSSRQIIACPTYLQHRDCPLHMLQSIMRADRWLIRSTKMALPRFDPPISTQTPKPQILKTCRRSKPATVTSVWRTIILPDIKLRKTCTSYHLWHYFSIWPSFSQDTRSWPHSCYVLHTCCCNGFHVGMGREIMPRWSFIWNAIGMFNWSFLVPVRSNDCSDLNDCYPKCLWIIRSVLISFRSAQWCRWSASVRDWLLQPAVKRLLGILVPCLGFFKFKFTHFHRFLWGQGLNFALLGHIDFSRLFTWFNLVFVSLT